MDRIELANYQNTRLALCYIWVPLRKLHVSIAIGHCTL